MPMRRPLWLPRWLRVLAACGWSACAHGPGAGVSAEELESAYLQARLPSAACRPDDPACCAERIRAARAAEAAGQTAASASLWQEVALACPGRRAEAAAAVRSTGRPPPPSRAPPAAPARVLNVAYRARLSPAVRLYWVSAAAAGRLMPTADPEPSATQVVQVEVQAIRFEGGRPGPLLRIERRFDVPFEPEAVITLEIAEIPGSGATPPSLEILPQVEPVPIARRRPEAAPPPRRPPPTLEKARPRKLDPRRQPLEFGTGLRGARPMVRLCLDLDGRFETLRFLEPAHPRLAASIIDMFRDARYEPYRVNDRPVPSCDVTRPS
jgi:hypothetical protein